MATDWAAFQRLMKGEPEPSESNPYEDVGNPYDDVDEIPNVENLLQGAINEQSRKYGIDPLSGMSGGIPAVIGGANRAEDAVPGIVQTGTDLAFKLPPLRAAGVIPGVKFGATVGATGLSELGKQGVKSLRGEGFDLSEAGKNTAITAGFEALGRGAEKALFRTQIGKELIGGAKKRLRNALTRLFDVARNNPNIQLAKSEFLSFLRDSYERIPFKIGPQATGMRKVIRTVENDFPEMLGPKEVSSTENMLGDIASFNPERSGDLKNKVANLSAKESRSYSSDVLDAMGERAGIPEVKYASDEAHLAQKFYSPRKKGLAETIVNKMRPGIFGIGAGLASQNPLVGLGAASADALLQWEPAKNLLYKLIVKSGASKAGRVGGSEVSKKYS